MKFLSKMLSFILIINFIFYPVAKAQNSQPQPKKVPFAIVKLLLQEMKNNPKEYFAEEELTYKNSLQDKTITNQVIEAIKNKLKDNSYSLAEVKQDIQAELLTEEQNKLIELKFILSKLSTEKLDQIFNQSLQDGMYNSEFELAYESAYNQLEKIEIIMQMLSSDLSLIRSQNAKQIGMMSREELLKQIETTGVFLNVKNDKVIAVIIIVLAVAAAGFMTWGILSATKTRYEKKKAKLGQDYDQKEQDAKNQYTQDVQSLEQVFAERAKLREEGYVWQVCATTTNTKTSTCSYDYSTHSGQEVCVTHCLKNPATGAEAMPTKSCLSAFIPNNCFVKNPTAAGYDDGYHNGYNSGYNVGYDQGYNEAYDSAYNNAYSSAYNSGYNSGYNDGFDSGYADGVADTPDETLKFRSKLTLKTLLQGEADDRALGYKKGFAEGYAYALQLKVGLSL